MREDIHATIFVYFIIFFKLLIKFIKENRFTQVKPLIFYDLCDIEQLFIKCILLIISNLAIIDQKSHK